MTQNYGNHRQQPALAQVAFFSTVAAITLLGLPLLGLTRLHLTSVLGLFGIAVLCLCFAARVYTTKLQDRIIKLEMRYRTDKFLTADQQKALWGLSKRQIVAMRFASDAEMPALIERAAKENLSSKDIKKAVKDWQGDFDRT